FGQGTHLPRFSFSLFSMPHCQMLSFLRPSKGSFNRSGQQTNLQLRCILLVVLILSQVLWLYFTMILPYMF
ncbi:MAG: hypothetical protein NT121_17970, partial [Chloroflexi bacterium]|nr:hypothetical protein [Chloroflexota bacterium]